jgi:hypothetical protein
MAMPEHSRRTFLLAAGASTAAVAGGAGAVLPAGVSATAAPDVADPDVADPDVADPGDQRLVAYLGNPRSGEIVVMRGDRETHVTDHALAAALARLAG